MHTILHPCKSLFPSTYSSPSFTLFNSTLTPFVKTHKPSTSSSFSSSCSFKFHSFCNNLPLWRTTHVSFCSQDDVFNQFSTTQLSESDDGKERIHENNELELLNKPSPVSTDSEIDVEDAKEPENNRKDEALEPFLKFFKPRDSLEVNEGVGELNSSSVEDNVEREVEKVNVDYYEPKNGEFVVGVVVSGNENKLDVNIGADLLGTMLTKEVLPLYDKEMEYLLCDTKKDAEKFMVKGKMGIVKYDDAVSGGPWGPGRPVVETGTVLFAEVLGRTLSGRPLLSTRRLFRRIAWHRVRQIKELNEPIEVKITEWNTGGLLTRIEGLRAFLPKAELMSKVNNFKELKQNVGRSIYVLISRINETNNDLILSEREAWEMLNLREGTLLEGTVKKIFPFGAQVRIGETNRSGLVHISNISRARITAVGDLLKVDERVKVLVVKSMFPDKIALSIADLESEPGLFITNKEKVYAEAETMAKKYKQTLPAVPAIRKSEIPPTDALLFDKEETLYANWKWFKFERDDETS